MTLTTKIVGHLLEIIFVVVVFIQVVVEEEDAMEDGTIIIDPCANFVEGMDI